MQSPQPIPQGISSNLDSALFDHETPNELPRKRIPAEFTLAVHHPTKPYCYVLNGDAYAVGRDQTNAIRVNNRFVSRRHAYLVRVPSQDSRSGFTYCLIDGNRKGQSSTNGVFVNGEQVATHYLKSGDVLHFGPEIKAYFYEIVPLPAVPNPFGQNLNGAKVESQ